ncbi:glutathione S-transferase [Achromobacter aloeverae]|uniref:Glutathione S-transferase n=1 Tax=Achromobacter aloeverae TaxID=1750518 RepID=A0A4V1MSD8_9BURK|nr:glutathione S-transferase [Achromobacter aloeverae]RXN91229.1 glutathione S-transferase [Achromobacter aloeverae]
MKFELIGMLDSPFVRRVAISMQIMGVPYVHRAISVFRGYDTFRAINPVVKAPTLVTEDGQVLTDSTLILQYLEALVPEDRRLVPEDAGARLSVLRLTGLALVASEKAVQIAYERFLRPEEKRHQPWVDRVEQQLRAAFDEIENDLRASPLVWATEADVAPVELDGISVAVAWYFTQRMLPGLIDAADYPLQAAWSALAEEQAPFKAAPYTP